jgi:hypothetical protein
MSPEQQKFYYRLKELGSPVAIYSGQALKINGGPNNPPRCLECGLPSRHELQVNSSLLSEFKELTYKEWGVVSIYTCSHNCGGRGVFQEVIILEDEAGQLRKVTPRPKKAKDKSKPQEPQKKD